jgi:hypothetical protein
MKAIKQNWQMVAVCVAMLATALLLISARTTFGNITGEQPTGGIEGVTTYQFFATSTTQATSGLYATSSTATSTNITAWTDSNGRIDNGYANIAGAKKVVLQCDRGDKLGGGNTGSTVCRFQVSNDASNWYYFERTTNATSTGALIPGAIAGTSTIQAAMDLDYSAYKFLRCIVVETTDGSHECKAIIEF